MSFLSKIRGSTGKTEKTQKKGWIPPKLPSPVGSEDVTTTTDSSLNDQPRTQGDGNVPDVFNTNLYADEDSNFSFLNKDAESSVTEDQTSAFSFIGTVVDKENEDTPAKTVARSKLEATPHKKKKKKKMAVKPGYGNNPDESTGEMLHVDRRSSYSSTSESRSDGQIEDECKNESSSLSSIQPNDTAQQLEDVDTSVTPFSVASDSNEFEENQTETAQKEEDDPPIEAAVDILEEVESAMGDNSLEEPDIHVTEINTVKGTTVDEPVKPTKEYDLSGLHVHKTEYNDAGQDQEEDGINMENRINVEENGDISASSKFQINSGDSMDSPVHINSPASDSKIDLYDLNLSQEEQTEVYLEILQSREKALRDDLADLKESQLMLYASTRDSLNSKEQLEAQIEELNKNQDIAIASDDFLSAEKINYKIEQTQAEIESLKFTHPILDFKISSLVDRCNKCLTNQQKECKNLQAEFQGIVSRENELLKRHISAHDTNLYKEKLKLQEETAKLHREMSHINLDKEHFEKNETQLNSEIYKRTKPFHLEKNELLEQRQSIQTEIQKLEEKLSTLKKAECDVNNKIDDVDAKIDEITLDFVPQQENLNKERAVIDEKEQRVTTELESFNRMEEELDEQQKLKESFITRCQKNIDNLNQKISTIDDIQREIDDEIFDFDTIMDFNLLKVARDKSHESLQDDVKKLTDEMNGLNCKIRELSAEAARLRKAIDDIETRNAELEKEKQIAVSKRNFKAAKQLTEERKLLIQNGHQSQERLKQLEEENKNAQLMIQKLEQEVSERRTNFQRVEIELDRKISCSLMDAISALQLYLERPVRCSWIEPFLMLEISTCKSIIKNIHEKYGWPELDFISEQEETDNIKDDSTNERMSEKVQINDDEVENENHDKEQIKCKLEELESILQKAVDEEDYDKADEINNEIEAYRTKHLLQL